MDDSYNKMYNAIDIARYIINKSNEKGYDISNLKLQKILYFVQAEFISKTPNSTLCFGDRMEAWAYGPVVPSVYQEFKRFGSNQIPTIKKILDFDVNTLSVKEIDFVAPFVSDDDKLMVDEVIDECSLFSVAELIDITHGQQPWKDAYRKGKGSTISGRQIKKHFTNEKS